MAETKIIASGNRGDFAAQVKGAVIWRSGSQIAGQLVAWTATFLVIRLLDPSDYGLIAMTGVVLMFLDLFNGWGFASALVRDAKIDRRTIAQAFGLLLMVNGALAALQFLAAPYAAAYFHQPMIADLLRVQALFFLANPFTALGNALLIRRMDFRRQSQINLGSALIGAFTAVGCALAGLGVWTLVAAPGALWFSRALGFAVAARLWIVPRFDFAGAGAMARFGGAMTLVQFLWFVQSQADVVIAGHLFDAHRIGLYTTALFLTQIVASKFVPPLNEVAFAAYSRIQDDPEFVAGAFLKTVRLIMLVALPFYLGMAVTAEPLVLTLLGEEWAAAAPLVPVLALAMAMTTLQILFAPATNALGRPAIAVRVGVVGALLMPVAFATGVQWGLTGLAFAWLGGMAALTAATVALSLPAIGAGALQLARALAAPLGAAAAMAASVAAADALLPPLAPAARLALLVPLGALVYGALLMAFARDLLEEVAALVRPRRAAVQAL